MRDGEKSTSLRVENYVHNRVQRGEASPFSEPVPHLQIMEPTDAVTVVTVICFCSDDAVFIHFSSFPSLAVASGMFKKRTAVCIIYQAEYTLNK